MYNKPFTAHAVAGRISGCRLAACKMNNRLGSSLISAWGAVHRDYHGKHLDDNAVKKRGATLLSAAEKGSATVSRPSDVDRTAELCDSGLPDMDVCDVLLTPTVQKDILTEAWSRGRWLLGLLVLQSMSSVVLENYQQLIKDHLVVTLFLTMLVGAGGNAGNQSAIKVIRGLATKSISMSASSIRKTMLQQGAIGVLLGAGLAGGGFVRVYLTNGSVLNATAISVSLFTIVLTSVLAGTALPFALAAARVDPANAGTSIQVVMDISGCLLTCFICHFILDTLAKGLAT